MNTMNRLTLCWLLLGCSAGSPSAVNLYREQPDAGPIAAAGVPSAGTAGIGLPGVAGANTAGAGGASSGAAGAPQAGQPAIGGQGGSGGQPQVGTAGQAGIAGGVAATAGGGAGGSAAGQGGTAGAPPTNYMQGCASPRWRDPNGNHTYDTDWPAYKVYIESLPQWGEVVSNCVDNGLGYPALDLCLWSCGTNAADCEYAQPSIYSSPKWQLLDDCSR